MGRGTRAVGKITKSTEMESTIGRTGILTEGSIDTASEMALEL